jgi:hypothetical protein
MANFNYDTIVSLYNSSKAVITANKATFTPYNRRILLELREDVDFLGVLNAMTGSNWDSENKYIWKHGTTVALETDKKLWLSYITDLRTACEELATALSISAPTWTIATANLKPMYIVGKTATISGTVLTQTGADVDMTRVTNSTDRCFIRSGTGATVGSYLITANTTTTLTLSGYSGDSSAGDVIFEVQLSANNATHTDTRRKSLITDIRTAILAARDASYTYYVDKTNGLDTNPGTAASPFKTWNKAVTTCNTTPGSIFFFPGSYTADVTLTASTVTISGTFLGEVFILPSGTTAMTSGNTGTTWYNFFFGDGVVVTANTTHFNNSSSLTVRNCVFLDGGAGKPLRIIGGSSQDFTHCAILGDPDDKAIDLITKTGSGLTLRSCSIVNGIHGISCASAGTPIAEINCMLENNTSDRFGGYTTNITNEHDETSPTDTRPNYFYRFNGMLRDNSSAIGQAANGGDIGAFESGPYNVYQLESETLTLADTPVDKTIHAVEETILLHDEATEVGSFEQDMNLEVDLALFGLFNSAADSTVQYMDAATAESAVDLDNFKDGTGTSLWQYDGAVVDIHWDNAIGHEFEVYIAVDDGSSDYTNLAWWDHNAFYPATTTSATHLEKGYARSLWKDCENNVEWGGLGTFSTVTADGVNDKQWDIEIHIRVKNVDTGWWSELVTLSKTYNFNDFDKVMHFCADNPRCVDNEYYTGANYLAQTYHTGTDKYTGFTGIDWINDPRRAAYNPCTKMFRLMDAIMGKATFLTGGSWGQFDVIDIWRDRETGGIGDYFFLIQHRARTMLTLWTGVYVNYGNYNTGSAHCFTSPTAQVHEAGIANGHISPFNASVSPLSYIRIVGVTRPDSFVHSSHQGWLAKDPSGYMWGYNDYMNFAVAPHSSLFAQFEEWVWEGRDTERYYFHVPDNQIPPDYPDPPGLVQVWNTTVEVHINTHDTTGAQQTGRIAFHGTVGSGSLYFRKTVW